jgi:hypothetical protein
VELGVFLLGVLLEKARFDLKVRRWWATRFAAAPSELVGATGPVTVQTVRREPPRRPVPPAVALAGVDARRLLLRPSTVLGAYVLFRVMSPPLPLSTYEGVNRLVGFTLAFTGLAALVLVASIGGRDRGAEIVEATPAGVRAPVLSWVVLLAGLAVLEYGFLLLLRFGRETPVYRDLLPNGWELTQGPIMLLGGGLLGLLAARLLPVWAAAPVGVVVATAWVGIVSGTFDSTSMLGPVVEWIQYREDGLVRVEPGSFAWHNAYLLGLCGLGLVATLLTVPGRRRALLVAGAVIAVATAVAGALALP